MFRAFIFAVQQAYLLTPELPTTQGLCSKWALIFPSCNSVLIKVIPTGSFTYWSRTSSVEEVNFVSVVLSKLALLSLAPICTTPTKGYYARKFINELFMQYNTKRKHHKSQFTVILTRKVCGCAIDASLTSTEVMPAVL